ncbi:MAG TPA: EAL domain-containing protein [Sedimenticola thiotaurini]|uniref:EAL domain-containing protein n=1 Tax=Sedimenticola thiotaurini TaxID=1543721 RepID=A0A831RKF5_9GAMM|nr:EAL domain-containing protein [Sedimenticola thiotaurini]
MSRLAAIHRPAPTGRPPLFFSLKWKAVLLLSLILLAVNVSLVTLGVMRLEGQFQRQRALSAERRIREFSALVERSFSSLERIGPLVMEGSEGWFPMLSLEDRLVRQLTGRAAALEVDWDITTLLFMDAGGKVRYSQGGTGDDQVVREMMRKALRTETVGKLLHCTTECHQLVAVPLLLQGQVTGVLLLGRTVADTVSTFRSISGSDLAIVTGDRPASGLEEDARWLPRWGRRLALASSPQRLIPALRSISERIVLSRIAAGRPYRFDFEESSLEVVRVPAGRRPWNDDNDLLLIGDITAEIAYIDKARHQSIGIGLAGLLLSELLLLFLLWAPMNRLKRLASALPRLAGGETVQVRSELGSGTKQWLEDEIDVALDAAMSLASRLEALDRKVQSRTENLLQRSRALARERDFVAGLLNSAQVVILTQDADGFLRSLNLEGQRVTGRDTAAIGRERFIDMLDPASRSEELNRNLALLRQGSIESYHHESHVLVPDGRRRSVSWVHSRLIGPDGTDAVRVLSVGLDITDREEAERNLAWLADHDPLTELINRRRFQLDFQQILTLNQRYRRQGALFFFDLDQFKYINDTSGHQAGDAMLRVVANALRQVIRDSDILARLGGDEFALVVPETDADGAIWLANRILETLAEIELPVHGRSHRISASIGIALFPDHGGNIQDLMANADLAMYQAKDVGRGRWHLFSWGEQRREQLNEEVRWKQRIEQALQQERLFLEFQPIMAITDSRVSHYECLLRMRNGDDSVSMPGSFIPVAERSGLIHRIDRYVLRHAIATLQATDPARVSLSLNLSGRVVGDPELLPLLRTLLQESGVDPARLLVEITETAALADIQSAERLMGTIRQLGCRTALDDFGVGFSSFFYLKELPVDVVKIDGSFIRHLAHSSDDRIFVKAMAEVARGLGKKTVAEFVEDETTLRMLGELQVDFAQGYFVGRPGPLPGSLFLER